jgi:oxygen-independent coproporphyrinogen-3 oxidase
MPIEGSESLDREQVDMERIGLGLRTKEGFDLGEIREGAEMSDILGRLEAKGLIQLKGNRVMPTKKGFAVADVLPLYLI